MSRAQEVTDSGQIAAKTGLKHIAIIMDGNRRWAKERCLPGAIGHQKGVEILKNTLKTFNRLKIKYLTVYAFSTENWNRKKEEVDFLMGLLAKTLTEELDELCANNVKIRFIGNLDKLNDELRKILENAQLKTKENNGVNLQIAFNYGSRDEITNAVKKIAQMTAHGALKAEQITEETIAKALYTSDIPDPDLLIRTGGEMRISNYLLWQIAYSEFYVTNKYWPEFDESELLKAIEEFERRNRRFGK